MRWAAERYGSRTAFVFGDRRCSFDELHRRSNRLAHALMARSLRRGERVALLLDNGPEYVEALFALMKAALVTVPVNLRLSAAERRLILLDCGAATAICTGAAAELLALRRRELPDLREVFVVGGTNADAYDVLLASGSETDTAIEVDEEEIETIRYTSGTTGVPKGAMYSTGAMYQQLTHSLLNLGDLPGADDRMLHATSLGHGSGRCLMPFWVRGAVQLLLANFDAEMVLQLITREKVTHFYLVPTMLNALLERFDPARHDVASIKRLFYGGAPISEQTLHRSLQVFGPVLRQQYGSTETGNPITALEPDDHVAEGTPEQLRRLQSAGRPALGTELRIIDDEGHELPRGELGEIAVRRMGMMHGYWNRPDAAAKALREGWMHTGDMGVMDECGYVYIRDRKNDMIITGGYNVYPGEVERALQCHPGVSEAAVIGVPDAYWGQSVKAFVVRRGYVSEEELIEWCKSEIASYKKPRVIEFVDELPKNPAGKVVRRLLKERSAKVSYGAS
ncbi:MAG: hypothetical protein A3G24_23025 [Betaproteobacteria bacterium RIFCSPLOWO2_12_FULL_62_13]|nr:MAG: hypothetical protein A3G24_23025 [Betaproteobacteria bacterium RIFCSPLOWO2_12_FULL_62_13]